MTIEPFYFDHASLMALAASHRAKYINANPFPHVVLDNFLPEDVAAQIADGFPRAQDFPQIQGEDSKYQPRKLGQLQKNKFKTLSPYIHHVLLEFNSLVMIDFLEALTSIQGLVSDPYYNGGGLHQILTGGKLAVHADFSLDQRTKLNRRLNVLVYFNRDWVDGYGGFLELWERDMSRPVHKIKPIHNRCVIFSTDATSYHGHPDPLNTPEGITRNSMALYYYTNGRTDGAKEVPFTSWQMRDGEKLRETNPRYILKSALRAVTPPIVYEGVKGLVGRLRSK